MNFLSLILYKRFQITKNFQLAALTVLRNALNVLVSFSITNGNFIENKKKCTSGLKFIKLVSWFCEIYNFKSCL